LVEFFVQRFSRELGKRIVTIPSEVMEVLKLHDWPGNIRELENIIKRAVIMSTGPALRPVLGELMRMPGQTSQAVKRTLAEAQREHIVEVLRETRWVLGGDNGAAARLGMPRTTLVYRMRKLGIDRDRGAKPFRSRPCGLQDSPVELLNGQKGSFLCGTERTVQSAFSHVGTA
jgi:formate hydrogenlyase transcriptional activator